MADHTSLAGIDTVCPGVIAALEDDPFYRSICGAYAGTAARRQAVLAHYFTYSIQEGMDIGRCVHLASPSHGIAVWLLPQTPDVRSRAAHKKRAFLETTLDAEGCANYYRIISFMSAKAASVVAGDAWYLSIVAVDPAAQGRGLGGKLLEPTLAEADHAGATCYLETFNPKTLSFYERLGFASEAQFAEPTTGKDYSVMVRTPNFCEKL